MTRKHFEQIAATIKSLDLPDAERGHVAGEFAAMCNAQNSNFNEARFIAACGVSK